MNALFVYAMISAAICGMVSLFELLQRYTYKAKLSDVLLSVPTFFYIAINILIGGVAVYASNAAGVVNFVDDSASISVTGLLKAAATGFGGLAVLRSNFATLTGDQKKADVGPSVILEGIRTYLDGKIRIQQKKRIDSEIKELMKNVDADKARFEVPALCVASTIEMTEEKSDDLLALINGIFDMPVTQTTKGMLLGHALCDAYGMDVLTSAVTQLHDVIRIDDTSAKDSDLEFQELLIALRNAKKKFSGGK